MNYLSINELQEEQASVIVDRENALADALDVKTSIILAIIVFLAAELDHFFPSPVTGNAKVLLYISVASLVFGVVFAVFELWPRNYGGEAAPSRYNDWIKKLRHHYRGRENLDAIVLERAIAGRNKRTLERAGRYIALNRRKTNFLEAAFYCTCASLAANLAALAIRLF